jgi:hypothetical protein
MMVLVLSCESINLVEAALRATRSIVVSTISRGNPDTSGALPAEKVIISTAAVKDTLKIKRMSRIWADGGNRSPAVTAMAAPMKKKSLRPMILGLPLLFEFVSQLTGIFSSGL